MILQGTGREFPVSFKYSIRTCLQTWLYMGFFVTMWLKICIRFSEGCSDLFTEQTFILHIADGIGGQGFFWTHEFYSCNYNQNVNRLWIDFRMLITLRGFIIGKVDTWKFSFVWKSTFKQLLTLSLWLLFIIHVIHVQGK